MDVPIWNVAPSRIGEFREFQEVYPRHSLIGIIRAGEFPTLRKPGPRNRND